MTERGLAKVPVSKPDISVSRQHSLFQGELLDEAYQLETLDWSIDRSEYRTSTPPSGIVIRLAALPLHRFETRLENDVLVGNVADAPGDPLKGKFSNTPFLLTKRAGKSTIHDDFRLLRSPRRPLNRMMVSLGIARRCSNEHFRDVECRKVPNLALRNNTFPDRSLNSQTDTRLPRPMLLEVLEVLPINMVRRDPDGPGPVSM